MRTEKKRRSRQASSIPIASQFEDEVSTGSGGERVTSRQTICSPGCDPVATAPGTDSITSTPNYGTTQFRVVSVRPAIAMRSGKESSANQALEDTPNSPRDRRRTGILPLSVEPPAMPVDKSPNPVSESRENMS